MDVLQEMQKRQDELTDSERKVYDIVFQDPTEICSSTTMQIAARHHISQSSISRFCQKLGYGSFSEFRMALYLSTQIDVSPMAEEESGKDLAYWMSQMVLDVRDALPETVLKPLVKRLMTSAHIYLSGSAYSSIPAQLLALQMTLSSLPASFVPHGSETAALHGITSRDTYILFSAGNPTHADLLDAANEVSPQKRPYIILVTLTPRHPLRKKADQVICLPSWATLHYPMAVDITFTTNVFCNLLLHYLSGYLAAKDGTDGGADQA